MDKVQEFVNAIARKSVKFMAYAAGKEPAEWLAGVVSKAELDQDEFTRLLEILADNPQG